MPRLSMRKVFICDPFFFPLCLSLCRQEYDVYGSFLVALSLADLSLTNSVKRQGNFCVANPLALLVGKRPWLTGLAKVL